MMYTCSTKCNVRNFRRGESTILGKKNTQQIVSFLDFHGQIFWLQKYELQYS